MPRRQQGSAQRTTNAATKNLNKSLKGGTREGESAPLSFIFLIHIKGLKNKGVFFWVAVFDGAFLGLAWHAVDRLIN